MAEPGQREQLPTHSSLAVAVLTGLLASRGIVCGMRMLATPLLASCALIGAAACSESNAPSHVAASRAGLPSVPERVQSNQRTLTAAQSRVLVAWTKRFRICLQGAGVHTTVKITRQEILMPLTSAVPRRTLLARAVRCGDALGGPPPRASLHTFPRYLVLYLPKQCLLDPRVVGDA